MTDETIVAVYDTPAHAELAAEDLKQAGVPANAISVHSASGSVIGDRITQAPRERGFWANLFGGEPDHDVDVYQRSVASGSTVVTVQIAETQAATVLEILNDHQPVDLDERAASYGLAQPASAPIAGRREGAAMGTPASAALGRGETVQLSEEQLSIGKRVVNRGTTRIRRFVVETPVEQQVTLRDETVTVERRPAAGQTASNPSFTEQSVEVQAFGEEPVVSKNARVVEEVVIGKQGSDRTETVRDTVRREDVEITKAASDTASVSERAASRPGPRR